MSARARSASDRTAAGRLAAPRGGAGIGIAPAGLPSDRRARRRRTLLLALAAPLAIPIVLLLVAAFLVAAIAGGGSLSSEDVPPGGVTGGLLKGGVPVPASVLRLIGPAVQSAGSPHLTESLLAAQLYQESGFDPGAVSPVGAQGIAQFMPGTWAAHGRDENGDGRADPFDIEDAVPAAARYDAAIATQVAGVAGEQTALMLAAYNAGPAAVLQYQGIPPYQETQAYVRRILDLASEWAVAPGLVGGGEGPVPPPEPGQVDVTGNRIIDTAVAWAVGQVGSWYQWGGTCRDPFGPSAVGRCDCSSLMQQAYARAGVSLPRVAADQARTGQEVPAEDVRPGDLIATEGSLGSPTRAGHIGMYIGRGMAVESPHTGAKVRIVPARSYTDIISIRRIVTG